MASDQEQELKALLPCPWCGGPVKIGDAYEGYRVRPAMNYPGIVCAVCNYCIDFGMRSSHKIKQKWNERAEQGGKG